MACTLASCLCQEIIDFALFADEIFPSIRILFTAVYGDLWEIGVHPRLCASFRFGVRMGNTLIITIAKITCVHPNRPEKRCCGVLNG